MSLAERNGRHLFVELKQTELEKKNSKLKNESQRVGREGVEVEKNRTRPAASIFNFMARMPSLKKLPGKQPTDLTPEDFRRVDRSRPHLPRMLVMNEDVHCRRGVVVGWLD